MRPRLSPLAAAILAIAIAGCESGDVRPTAPRGATALERFVVVGGDISAGAAGGGLTAASQVTAWPALIAADAGVTFRQAVVRAPGCSPPLVAPLLIGRWLSGTGIATRDSSCAGAASTLTPPMDNLALPGATAYAALQVTPRAIDAAKAAYDVVDRARYPLVLGPTQSQVTAMLVRTPTLVAVELGLGEVLPAFVTGRVVAATAYTPASSWTYVPAAVAAPVFSAIGDSIVKSAARVVVLTAPRLSRLPAFRTGAQVAAQRVALAGYGVTVATDCEASANVIHVSAKLPALVQAALRTGVAQPFSCTDSADAADRVLTPAQVATLDAVVDAINAQVRQLAQAHGWAVADLDAAFTTMAAAAPAFDARRELTCAQPYGPYFSLDGLRPSATGQRLVADVVAAALNAKFGYALPVAGTPLTLLADPCG
jgi:hypothetical protein